MSRRAARFRLAEPEPEAPTRLCEHPGCLNAGDFRAPRDRTLRDWFWFCLPHVREYNSRWDYYKGMTPEEIENNLRSDSGWQRPTWPLGRLGTRLDPEMLRDPLGMLRDNLPDPPVKRRRENEVPPELRAAIELLDVGWPLDPAALRARYKELAKRYHPDVTGGDKGAEERLKDINRAYSLLRRRLQDRPPPQAHAASAAAG
jgi:hypothetical protein